MTVPADQLQAALKARGAKSISTGVGGEGAGQNADIADALSSVQLQLVNSDTRFADIFHRYLSRDDLS